MNKSGAHTILHAQVMSIRKPKTKIKNLGIDQILIYFLSVDRYYTLFKIRILVGDQLMRWGVALFHSTDLAHLLCGESVWQCVGLSLSTIALILNRV